MGKVAVLGTLWAATCAGLFSPGRNHSVAAGGLGAYRARSARCGRSLALSAPGSATPVLQEVSSSEAGRFATRRLYGRYLRALLYDEMLQSGGRVLLCTDEVATMIRRPGGWDLLCTSGRVVSAAAVVIAAGNLPSGRIDGDIVFHDPWRADATANLRPGEPVLVIGTGLSMVDLAVAMAAQGFHGPIVALSRRGLVPQRHCVPMPAWPWDAIKGAGFASARPGIGGIAARVPRSR